MDQKQIIDRLIELRDINNLTNYALAAKSNLPSSTISNIFNRKTTPQFDTLIAICNGLGITLAQFFNEGEKYSQLSEQEAHMLTMWNFLNDEQQKILVSVMDQFLKK